MAGESLIRKATGSAYHSVILKGVFQALSLIATILLIRVLSKEDYGAYNLISSAIPLLQMVGSLGLLNVVQRFLPEYVQSGDAVGGRRLVLRISVLRLVTSACLLAVVVLGWDSLAPLVKLEAYRNYFLLFVLAILSFQQWALFKVALESGFGHREAMAMLCASALIRVVGYAAASQSESPLLVVLSVDTGSYLLLAIANIVMYLRQQRAAVSGSKGVEVGTRRLVRYALFSHFNDAGVQLLDTGVDNLFLAYFMDLKAVAIYTFCNEVSRKLARFSPISYLGDVIRPLVFAKGANLRQDRVDAAVQLSVKLVAVYFVPLLFAVMILGRQLIDLIFGKYGEHHMTLVTVLAFVAVNEFGFAIGLVAQWKERVDILLYSKVFGVYNFVASLLLIPSFGVMGVAIATGTAGLLKNLFVWWFLRRHINLGKVPRHVAACVLYWGLWSVLLAALLSPVPGVLRLVGGGLGFIVGFAVYVRFVYLASTAELEAVGALVDRRPGLGWMLRLLSRSPASP